MPGTSFTFQYFFELHDSGYHKMFVVWKYVGSFFLIFFPQDDHVETCGPCYVLKIMKHFRR